MWRKSEKVWCIDECGGENEEQYIEMVWPGGMKKRVSDWPRKLMRERWRAGGDEERDRERDEEMGWRGIRSENVVTWEEGLLVSRDRGAWRWFTCCHSPTIKRSWWRSCPQSKAKLIYSGVTTTVQYAWLQLTACLCLPDMLEVEVDTNDTRPVKAAKIVYEACLNDSKVFRLSVCLREGIIIFSDTLHKFIIMYIIL